MANLHHIGSDVFSLAWSCYKGLQVHCGVCGTCVERKEAFVGAHVHDPTAYAT